jgi:hypothetical protein
MSWLVTSSWIRWGPLVSLGSPMNTSESAFWISKVFDFLEHVDLMARRPECRSRSTPASSTSAGVRKRPSQSSHLGSSFLCPIRQFGAQLVGVGKVDLPAFRQRSGKCTNRSTPASSTSAGGRKRLSRFSHLGSSFLRRIHHRRNQLLGVGKTSTCPNMSPYAMLTGMHEWKHASQLDFRRCEPPD